MSIRKELLFRTDHKTWGFVDVTIALVVATGIVLSAWGVIMNYAVVAANNGVMPIITTVEDIPAGNGGTSREYVDDGHLLILADRITIRFPDWTVYIPNGRAGKAINWWSKWLDYPLDGGLSVISIGDIFRWIGSALFLLGNIFLIPLTLWRLHQGALPRIFKK